MYFIPYFQDKRKDVFKTRKERLDLDQSEREKSFLERLHEAHEVIFLKSVMGRSIHSFCLTYSLVSVLTDGEQKTFTIGANIPKKIQ